MPRPWNKFFSQTFFFPSNHTHFCCKFIKSNYRNNQTHSIRIGLAGKSDIWADLVAESS